MCRYGIAYKPHYACFACRKAFRRPLLSDIQRGGADRPFRCPQCAGEMANMGLDFAAPKQKDEKAWRVAESLFEVGETFHSCGCTGPGYRPRDPDALRAFLEARLQEFEHNALEKPPRGDWVQTRRRRQRYEPHSPEQIQAYWNDRADQVRRALVKLPARRK